MTRDWETTFRQWASSPAQTEQERCENAITTIRNAIASSDRLKIRHLKVFVQGSYRNRVNVRRESDVDIGVLCNEAFIPDYPEGTSKEDFRHVDADYQYGQFKNELEGALVAYFGRSAVRRGNKALNLNENSYRVDADVAPFFEYRSYERDGRFRCGVALYPDNGGRVFNFPERLLDDWPNTPLHYENGVAKNTATRRTFKGTVRILKTLRNEMEENGIVVTNQIPGFLIECLIWNVPNLNFSPATWLDTVKSVLYYLWSNTTDDEMCKNWCEVNDIKYLFHPSQPWTRSQAHAFINGAWDYLGLPRS